MDAVRRRVLEKVDDHWESEVEFLRGLVRRPGLPYSAPLRGKVPASLVVYPHVEPLGGEEDRGEAHEGHRE